MQRSFLGDIRTTQPCPTCGGYGSVIPNPCPECSGDGRVRSARTINVKIPAGVSTGNRIHLAAHGEVGAGGGPAGDLYVELVVAAHEIFRREGDDLEVTVRIPMTAAALGTEVTVQTLEADLPDTDDEDREVRVTVAAGTQSGTRVALDGWGVPKLRSNGAASSASPCSCRRRRASTTSSASCCASSPSCARRPGPDGTVQKQGRGVFGRLRNAFADR